MPLLVLKLIIITILNPEANIIASHDNITNATLTQDQAE